MATHASTPGAPMRATTFIAKLLAPLPADVPQANDKSYMRLLKQDAATAWRRSLRRVTVAKARLDYVRAQRLLDPTVDERQAFAAFCLEIDRQTAVPTIVAEGISWKRSHAMIGACREVIERREALIALDVVRREGF